MASVTVLRAPPSELLLLMCDVQALECGGRTASFARCREQHETDCPLALKRREAINEPLERAHEYDLFVSEHASVTKKGAEGAAQLRAMMMKQRFRANAPVTIGGLEVMPTRDYLAQTCTERAPGAKAALSLPPSDVLPSSSPAAAASSRAPAVPSRRSNSTATSASPSRAAEPMPAAHARADAIVTR